MVDGRRKGIWNEHSTTAFAQAISYHDLKRRRAFLRGERRECVREVVYLRQRDHRAERRPGSRQNDGDHRRTSSTLRLPSVGKTTLSPDSSEVSKCSRTQA